MLYSFTTQIIAHLTVEDILGDLINRITETEHTNHEQQEANDQQPTAQQQDLDQGLDQEQHNLDQEQQDLDQGQHIQQQHGRQKVL